MTSVRIIVSSRLPGGHRRGGRLWPSEQTEAEVEEKLLEEIRSDAHLVVLELPSPPVQLTAVVPAPAQKGK